MMKRYDETNTDDRAWDEFSEIVSDLSVRIDETSNLLGMVDWGLSRLQSCEPDLFQARLEFVKKLADCIKHNHDELMEIYDRAFEKEFQQLAECIENRVSQLEKIVISIELKAQMAALEHEAQNSKSEEE